MPNRSFDESNARHNVPTSFLQPDPLFGEGSRISHEEFRPTEVDLLKRQLQEVVERRLETLAMVVQLQKELVAARKLIERITLRVANCDDVGYRRIHILNDLWLELQQEVQKGTP